MHGSAKLLRAEEKHKHQIHHQHQNHGQQEKKETYNSRLDSSNVPMSQSDEKISGKVNLPQTRSSSSAKNESQTQKSATLSTAIRGFQKAGRSAGIASLFGRNSKENKPGSGSKESITTALTGPNSPKQVTDSQLQNENNIDGGPNSSSPHHVKLNDYRHRRFDLGHHVGFHHDKQFHHHNLPHEHRHYHSTLAAEHLTHDSFFAAVTPFSSLSPLLERQMREQMVSTDGAHKFLPSNPKYVSESMEIWMKKNQGNSKQSTVPGVEPDSSGGKYNGNNLNNFPKLRGSTHGSLDERFRSLQGKPGVMTQALLDNKSNLKDLLSNNSNSSLGPNQAANKVKGLSVKDMKADKDRKFLGLMEQARASGALSEEQL